MATAAPELSGPSPRSGLRAASTGSTSRTSTTTRLRCFGIRPTRKTSRRPTFLNAYRAYQRGIESREAAELADQDRAQRCANEIRAGEQPCQGSCRSRTTSSRLAVPEARSTGCRQAFCARSDACRSTSARRSSCVSSRDGSYAEIADTIGSLRVGRRDADLPRAKVVAPQAHSALRVARGRPAPELAQRSSSRAAVSLQPAARPSGADSS